MAGCRTMTCCIIASIAVAVVAVLISAISYPVVDNYMRKEITKRVLLTNGSQLYQTWKDPTIPIYIQIYMFDLQNPADVINGSKPKVVQKGPFTYKEHKVKVNLTHHDNGTVSYREISTYFFDDDNSGNMSQDTNITSVNIPLVTLINYIELNHPDIPKFLIQLFLTYLGTEDLFVTKTVKEYVWGYEDPMLKLAKKYLGTVLNITSDIVGVFAQKNNTDDGVYNIYTGETNITMLGVIDKYNGKSSVDFWTTPEANMVNGSDGTLCPPFVVDKNLKVMMYSSDICRSIPGVFQSEVSTTQNIKLYRYSAPKEAFEKPSLNPANEGFCTPAGNCMGTGVLNISVCQQMNGVPLPLVISLPHFFNAEEKYQTAVDGINPNQPHLSTDIDIEPHTGLVMQVAKRLQINVYLKNSSKLTSMTNLRTLVYPVLWVNESVVIDDKTAIQFRSDLLNPLEIVFILQLVLFGVGASLIILAAVLSALWLRRKSSEKDEINDSLINSSD